MLRAYLYPCVVVERTDKPPAMKLKYAQLAQVNANRHLFYLRIRVKGFY